MYSGMIELEVDFKKSAAGWDGYVSKSSVNINVIFTIKKAFNYKESSNLKPRHSGRP